MEVLNNTMKWINRIIFVIVFLFYIYSICEAADLGYCADALDSIRKAASNASDAANKAEDEEQELEDAEDELESAKDELNNCLTFPDIYDLLDDGCQSYRWDVSSAYSDYEYANNDYGYAINNLISELDTLAYKIRSMESSCGYEFTKVVVLKQDKKPQITVKNGNKVKPASVFTAKDSNIFHKQDCSKLDATNGLVEFTTSQQAQNAGGLPCNYCRP